MKTTAIQNATLSFNAEGTPVSREFDDVYFSNDNGLQETRYVFLNGNDLPARFEQHDRSVMVVAESGFGTGLNFLALWQAFDAFQTAHPEATLRHLHFISFEKFPLCADDLALAQKHWPELACLAETLRAQWPMAWPGCHRLLLAGGRITLDLWFGDINHLVDQLDASHNGQVDAWFLDGFAPAKNPDMWTPGLFSAIARLARPGGTLATFTAAGFVRRGLADAGFTMTRRKGFGRKREMLIGTRNACPLPADPQPWYARPAASVRQVALVGGGIASALLALMLLRRGWQVTLYCSDSAPGLGASGNRQGALYPLLSAHDPAIDSFFPAAFGFARRLYDTLEVCFEHDWCGVTQLGWDEKSQHKIDRMLSLNPPPGLARAITAEEASVLSGVALDCAAITYPAGGWLCPQQLTRQAMDKAQRAGMSSYYQHKLVALEHDEEGWRLHFEHEASARHPVVVLANGAGLSDIAQTAELPVYPVAGQVSHIPTNPVLAALRQVLCYDGYLTPVSPATGQHCIGASYHRGSRSVAYSYDDQRHNRQRLSDCFPTRTWPQAVDVSGQQARNGVRCATRDHLPITGNVPDKTALVAQYTSLATQLAAGQPASPAPGYPDLFVLGALGSRGLCSAPLAAEILAAQMSGEPLPLDAATLGALHPNRYWVRKLLKGRPV